MTIDERIEALTQSVELMAAMQKDHEDAYQERQLRIDERLLEISERHNSDMAEIRATLGRAIRASIQDARLERRKRQEMDKQHRERHAELQSLLKAFLERS